MWVHSVGSSCLGVHRQGVPATVPERYCACKQGDGRRQALASRDADDHYVCRLIINRLDSLWGLGTCGGSIAPAPTQAPAWERGGGPADVTLGRHPGRRATNQARTAAHPVGDVAHGTLQGGRALEPREQQQAPGQRGGPHAIDCFG